MHIDKLAVKLKDITITQYPYCTYFLFDKLPTCLLFLISTIQAENNEVDCMCRLYTQYTYTGIFHTCVLHIAISRWVDFNVHAISRFYNSLFPCVKDALYCGLFLRRKALNRIFFYVWNYVLLQWRLFILKIVWHTKNIKNMAPDRKVY